MPVMQISRKIEYALRAAIHLRKHGDTPSSLADISENEAIPKKFLEKIVQELAHAGVVRSKRGPYGGYVLGREAADISFKEIIEAVEGPISLNVCVGGHDDCSLTLSCGMLPVWQEGQRRVLDLFGETTLADI